MHIALQHLRSSPNAEVLWIDTVGSFSWKRLSQLVCGEQDKEDKEQEADNFLDSFIVWHFPSGDIMEFVNMVKEWITSRHDGDGEDGEQREERDKRMVLVVVDCVSNLFRPHRHPVLQERIESIRKVGLILRHLALKMDCTIVCVNQMSTKIGNYADVADSIRSPAQLQPALGTNWSVMMDLSLELRGGGYLGDSGSGGDVERTISIRKSDYTYKNNIINNMSNDHLPKEESFSISYHKVMIGK